jgi:hypothetical protein
MKALSFAAISLGPRWSESAFEKILAILCSRLIWRNSVMSEALIFLGSKVINALFSAWKFLLSAVTSCVDCYVNYLIKTNNEFVPSICYF